MIPIQLNPNFQTQVINLTSDANVIYIPNFIVNQEDVVKEILDKHTLHNVYMIDKTYSTTRDGCYTSQVKKITNAKGESELHYHVVRSSTNF